MIMKFRSRRPEHQSAFLFEGTPVIFAQPGAGRKTAARWCRVVSGAQGTIWPFDRGVDPCADSTGTNFLFSTVGSYSKSHPPLFFYFEVKLIRRLITLSLCNTLRYKGTCCTCPQIGYLSLRLVGRRVEGSLLDISLIPFFSWQHCGMATKTTAH